MIENMQRTVIVTGAAQGIGLAIAEGFIKNGDFVAIGDLEDGITEQEALHKHLLNRQHLKRFVEPSEVAAAAIYLASDGAASVTGEAISVSGGM